MKECSLHLEFYGEGDFFTMKGVVEEFFSQVGMDQKSNI